MRVLVTGGAGFIGSHTVDALIAEGHNVTILDNLSSGDITFVNPKATFFREDILNRQRLAELLQAGSFDAVLHFAAQTMVSVSQSDPIRDAELNIMGTVLLLKAACTAGVKRFVFSSSAAIYGDVKELPILETAQKYPMSFYGLSKLSAERYIAMFAEHNDINCIVFRYANVYGERQGNNGEGGVVSVFARKFLERQPIRIFGNGEQTRDFIYVGDVARANCLALTTEKINAVYNISSQTETSVNRLVELFQNVSGRSSNLVFSEPRQGDVLRSLLSRESATEKLRWKPSVLLEEGLQRTYNSLSKL